MRDHAPLLPAVVVSVTPPASVTVTVLFASACPESEPPSALSVPDGVPGASVSTITVAALETLPVPLALVAVAVKAWLPSVKLPVGVKLQFPLAFAVVVPSSAPLL